MMWHEPRNWKWMVPATFTIVCTVGGAWMLVKEWYWWTWLSVWGIGLVCLMGWIINAWTYVQSHGANIYATIQAAQNSTPDVRMFEAAKVMHPEAVRALLSHRRMTWRIRYVAVRDLVMWVLDDAPGVNSGFLDFVLDYSNESSVMPKSMLSEGSKQFDPEGFISDYDQYDALILLLQHKVMCTQAYGNQPPKWIAPWTPELVRHRFGLDDGKYEAEGTKLLKAVERAQERKDAPISVNGELLISKKINEGIERSK